MAAAATGVRRGSRSSRVSPDSENGVHSESCVKRITSSSSENKSLKERIEEATQKKKYNVEDFYWDHGFWQSIARNRTFDNITLSIIAVNSIWLWIDTDYNDAGTLLEAHWVFQAGENFFCCFFCFELTVRFQSFKRKLDALKDSWFMFDALIVIVMVVETWAVTAYLYLTGGTGGTNMGAASVLRLFRLLRLSRMVRMLRSMTDLMILVKGMLSALRSVGTVMFLLLIVMYVFGIAMTQLAAGHSTQEMFFSNVQHSMYTLLVYGVFLDSIAKLCDTVGMDKDFYSVTLVILFFIFILVATLTVLNMLIGVLCEVVSRVAEKERNDIEVASVTEKLRQVVEALDKDGNLRISHSEFAQLLSDRDAVLALKAVEVDPEDLLDNEAFIFLKAEVRENEDEPALDFQDFMEALLELRGSNMAKVRDVIKFQKNITAQFQDAKAKLVPSSNGNRTPSKSVLKKSPSRESGRENSKKSVVSKASRYTSVSEVTDPHLVPLSTSESTLEGLPSPPLGPSPCSRPEPPATCAAAERPVRKLAPLDSFSAPPEIADGAPVRGPRCSTAPPGEQPSLQLPPSPFAAAARAAAGVRSSKSPRRFSPATPQRGAEASRELCQLKVRMTRLEGMIAEMAKEVHGLIARAEAHQLLPRSRNGVADSTGGIH